MAKYEKDSPYPQSRAALRQIYGTRAIGGPTQVSERDETPSGRLAREGGPDQTPSGRAAYYRSRGLSEGQIDQKQGERFRSYFGDQPQIKPEAVPSHRSIQQSGLFSKGLASPEDVGFLRQTGAQGTVQTPYGSVTLPPPTGLFPSSNPIDNMGEFLPTTVGPLSQYNLPKPTVLSSGSRWRVPIFG